eukprot:jgi/Chlat1/6559/Chrsp45S05928
MSGWDDGGVYYSAGQFGDEAPDGTQEKKGYSRHECQRKFYVFLKDFHQTHGKGVQHPYRERLSMADPDSVTLRMEDLVAFDETLAQLLKKAPADYMPLLEAAAADVVVSLRPMIERDGDYEEPQRPEVQVFLTSNANPLSIRQLKAEHISQLIMVPGIVIGATRVKAKASTVTLTCRNCKSNRVLHCKPGIAGVVIPRTCDRQPQPGEPPCPLDPYVAVPDKSKYMDQQTLKLQECPEDVPTGEMPRHLLLSVDRRLVQRVNPGTRVTIIGVFSIFQGNQNQKQSKAAATVRQPYIRVLGLDEHSETNAGRSSSFTQEEELQFKEFARQPDVYQDIAGRIAPKIFGHEDVKKAVACLLFSGARKMLPDGARLRGDINVLLIGDPSTAKSQFLKFVEKTAPVAVYTSGKGSSAAGLTASVIRDPSSGEFILEGGAMVLADGGVVCIDEFDKMRPEDRVAIHEAMEQQTISIAKAGITTVLNSRCSVLAAANPPSGRYDDMKASRNYHLLLHATLDADYSSPTLTMRCFVQSAGENIDLQTTILSRFDLIFIVKDERNYEKDLMIARHVLQVHSTADAENTDPEALEREEQLKRYVTYCRTHCSPRLSDRAAALLQNHYITIRDEARKKAHESRSGSAIPITVRQLEAVVRISEALAKMQLLHVVDETHVTEAIRLFNVSTIDAANSGLVDNVFTSDAEKADVQAVESAVKVLLGIGQTSSERYLYNQLARMGHSENAIRKAMYVLQSRGDLEQRHEGRSVTRKA